MGRKQLETRGSWTKIHKLCFEQTIKLGDLGEAVAQRKALMEVILLSFWVPASAAYWLRGGTEYRSAASPGTELVEEQTEETQGYPPSSPGLAHFHTTFQSKLKSLLPIKPSLSPGSPKGSLTACPLTYLPAGL